ncbi:RdgB/HAM1 family non-canonical purine NTP pyrophosphatase [Lipingzhangella sp. LS1_29]|uniref:dITP/XTP pyrophosphatase n=1 Tax=Lipingzhangella rawalii TaxID=2055835 RepID=A0ABU2HA27_9ACTN|nr:RdgB/HAM1 family non-canonical purine NTP pyrophosphatase [Lipingzhangella rawalii]MDS1272118.1 RdgB/HAM1 family non-canonical purine NTP pyrophosphatase [Lipingzhangella rawalii]
MSTIVLATRNTKKVPELRAVLAEQGRTVEIRTLAEYPDAPEVVETEPTFAGNARLKARAVAVHTGLPAVADDSGLCVDELNGMPGVLSARWSGQLGAATGDIDDANLRLVLDQMADVPGERRGARFVAVIAVAIPQEGSADPAEHVVDGTLEGQLLTEPRGANGFGYDPIFVPAGENRTTAELSATEKNAISHRGIALRRLSKRLSEVL